MLMVNGVSSWLTLLNAILMSDDAPEEPLYIMGHLVESVDPETWRQEQLDEWAKKIVDVAPDLTPTQLARLRQILSK